ncbi:MAG TPA: rhodanese-like domain-containing protein, partial [Fimbriimonadaceae bacterium]|nr:rhodanese-like domain-containing protein [Fimbriimonadaceae bacterium]
MNATVLDQPLTIEPADLARKIQEGENLVLIDVRTTGEFRSGHIPRSINIPMDEIEARLDDVPEGGQVVL